MTLQTFGWFVTLALLQAFGASCQRQKSPELRSAGEPRPLALTLISPSPSPSTALSLKKSDRTSEKPQEEVEDARKNRLSRELSGRIDQKRLESEEVEGEIGALQAEMASSASGEREQAGQVAQQASLERLQSEDRAIQWQAYLEELGTRIQQQEAVVQALQQQNHYWGSLNIDTDEFRAVRERLAHELPRLQDYEAQRTNGRAQARLDAALQSSRSPREEQEPLIREALQGRIEQLEAQAEKLRQERRRAEQQLSRPIR